MRLQYIKPKTISRKRKYEFDELIKTISDNVSLDMALEISDLENVTAFYTSLSAEFRKRKIKSMYTLRLRKDRIIIERKNTFPETEN